MGKLEDNKLGTDSWVMGECSRLLSLGFLVQVLYGALDPGILGVSTDLLGQFGLEAVGREGTVRRSSTERPACKSGLSHPKELP